MPRKPLAPAEEAMMNSRSLDAAEALMELLARPISEADIERIAERSAELLAEKIASQDTVEMWHPMNQAEAAAWLGFPSSC